MKSSKPSLPNLVTSAATEIIESLHDLTVEDLITEEDRVVTISHGGYAKTQPLSDYQASVAAEWASQQPRLKTKTL